MVKHIKNITPLIIANSKYEKCPNLDQIVVFEILENIVNVGNWINLYKLNNFDATNSEYIVLW